MREYLPEIIAVMSLVTVGALGSVSTNEVSVEPAKAESHHIYSDAYLREEDGPLGANNQEQAIINGHINAHNKFLRARTYSTKRTYGRMGQVNRKRGDVGSNVFRG